MIILTKASGLNKRTCLFLQTQPIIQVSLKGVLTHDLFTGRDVYKRQVLAGLKISTADLEKPNSKGTSYKAAKACIAAFKEKNSTIVCRELKGVDTGKVLRACPDCICDAVAIIEENLFPAE